LKAEEQIAGINCDLADFLMEMTADPNDPVIVCVNFGASMKRHEQTIGGQLWIQSERRMTAMNSILHGTSNDRESAALSGIVQAVEWKHRLQQCKARTRRRL
jgi:hypothetical protein